MRWGVAGTSCDAATALGTAGGADSLAPTDNPAKRNRDVAATAIQVTADCPSPLRHIRRCAGQSTVAPAQRDADRAKPKGHQRPCGRFRYRRDRPPPTATAAARASSARTAPRDHATATAGWHRANRRPLVDQRNFAGRSSAKRRGSARGGEGLLDSGRNSFRGYRRVAGPRFVEHALAWTCLACPA